MDDIAALTHQLEYLFLKGLIHGLRNKKITVSEAKQFATEFLAIEPFKTKEDASNKIDEFCGKHNEFAEAKKYMDLYDKEEKVDEKIGKMRELLKNKNIDEALNVAQE